MLQSFPTPKIPQITIIFLPQKSAGCGHADSQSGSLCTGSEISHFEIVVSDKAGASRDVGTGVHYGGNAPFALWMGGQRGTGALTLKYHK